MEIGFIGLGNMGSAIAKGFYQSDADEPYHIFAYNPTREKLHRFEEQTKRFPGKKNRFIPCQSMEEVLMKSRWIVLGIKPQTYEQVLPRMAEQLETDQVIVSMAAGISIKKIEDFLGQGVPVIRIMPNLPVVAGQGMTALWKNRYVSRETLDLGVQLFETMGKVEVIEEELFHQVIGTAGSSPAYTFMYIQSLMEGAVAQGIPPEQARRLAAQSVLGAAKMVLETDEPLPQLIDRVCSKGGTTIEGVGVLQEENFAQVVHHAWQAVVKKSKVSSTSQL